jgi:hypothetical protein
VQTGFFQLVKSGKLMLHQNALQAAWITELEEQLAVMTKQKAHKRKHLQYGRTLEYGTGAAQVATEASATPQQLKKAHGSSNHKTAQPSLQRCRNCSKTGHNMVMCQKDAEESPESDASMMYAGSLFDNNEIKEL